MGARRSARIYGALKRKRAGILAFIFFVILSRYWTPFGEFVEFCYAFLFVQHLLLEAHLILIGAWVPDTPRAHTVR